jgi:hypothetical protein
MARKSSEAMVKAAAIGMASRKRADPGMRALRSENC